MYNCRRPVGVVDYDPEGKTLRVEGEMQKSLSLSSWF